MLIGFRRSGKPACFRGAVVFLDVLARAGDGQQIEQGEIVEAQHLDQPSRRASRLFQIQPAVELLLRLARRASMLRDAVLQQGGIVALGDEGDLVAQVGQAVVDRRGREHQHPGFHPFLDDLPHQSVVAGLAVLVAVSSCSGSCGTRR